MPEVKHPQRVLGVDYGSKRIGVAIGQSVTGTATPLPSIGNASRQHVIQSFAEIIAQWQPQTMVVGRPSHANGDPHSLWPEIDTFCANIHQHWPIPVVFVDEYLSSFEASEHACNGLSGSDGDIDSMAAKILIENWFRQNNDAHL